MWHGERDWKNVLHQVSYFPIDNAGELQDAPLHLINQVKNNRISMDDSGNMVKTVILNVWTAQIN